MGLFISPTELFPYPHQRQSERDRATNINYVQRRLTKILETAAALKRRRIQAMKDAKEAARDSRRQGD